ncbi:hypothetical protein [Azospirillum sp. TSO5]|uniref:hypothetical protein n=1 Tax=Azospirillum sp. TSO5 TaxID=716760 RepID=UPI0011B1CA30|nr:hypothetical protein [Azospirillum sp. TSO5]
MMLFNGIDRKDPLKGYTTENCVPCCFEINRAKSDMTIDEFTCLINDTFRHWASDRVDAKSEVCQVVCVKG